MSEDPGFFYRPVIIRRILHGFYGGCALLFILDLLVHRHTEHPWEGIPGFYPLYGFVGCVVLVLVAKQMRKILMRSEDYYGRSNIDQEDRNEP